VLELHRRLAERFVELSETRSGPVYFIEHGLDGDEVEELKQSVGAALQSHPLDDDWWEFHKLTIIVAAAEVGYVYEGHGTDFWPMLEGELSARFDGASRQRLRDLYRSAADTFRGAVPPLTTWTEAFHLIAWPITHALVPLEFRRPLAATLANLRSRIEDLDDEQLYHALRLSAPRGSVRFSTLLDDPGVIVSVARALLGGASDDLAPETVRRITEDLAADSIAKRSVAVARRIQRTAKARPRAARTAEATEWTLQGNLRLRRRGDALSLEASFPPLEGEIAGRLRRVLRRRRFAPSLWACTARVPSEQILSGLPFALRLSSFPEEGAALLPGIDELGIDADLVTVLAGLRLELRQRLLFAVSASGEIGRELSGTTISGARKYWLLATGDTFRAPADTPLIGEVGPYRCFELDPTQPNGASALEGLGYTIRFGISVFFAGDPPHRHGASVPTFSRGDRRYLVQRRPHPDGLRVELEGDEVDIDDELVRVSVAAGRHSLRAVTGGESSEFPFEGTARRVEPPPSSCWIEPHSPELTVQSLLSGHLSFVIDSFAALEGLKVTVEVEAGRRRFGVSSRLAPLPQVLSSDAEPFSTLLDDQVRAALHNEPQPAVHLRVGGIAAGSWDLEQRVRPVWWVREPSGMSLQSEVGALPFGAVPAAAPHLPVSPLDGIDDAGGILLGPSGLDGAEHGPAARFTTICLVPAEQRASLRASIQKPRLVRRHTALPRAAGLKDLVEAYLRWSLAESGSLVAELRRRQVVSELDSWIAEICCGGDWVKRELEAPAVDPWVEFERVMRRSSVGRDREVQLSEDDDRELLSLAMERIRECLPELWSRAGAPGVLSDEDYEALDVAWGDAYERLAEAYEERGLIEVAKKIEGGDPGYPPEDWDAVLRQVKNRSELHGLAQLLLPTDSAEAFIALAPSTLSLDDLAEELELWAKRSLRAFAGQAPTGETLRTILALWIAPEVAIRSEWERAIDVLLAERTVARATRYLALRRRSVSGGGAE